MKQEQFSGLRVGLMVKNNKTSKNWIITDFVTSFSSITKQSPDEYKVMPPMGTVEWLS